MSYYDLIVMVLYLFLMIYIGLLFKNRVKETSDYFSSRKELGFFVIMATVCASIIGGGAMIGRGGVTYTQGAVAVMLGIPYLIGMYVFTYISGRIQK